MILFQVESEEEIKMHLKEAEARLELGKCTTVQSESYIFCSMINCCDTRITHLGEFEYIFFLLKIYHENFFCNKSVTKCHPKGISKLVNRLNKPKDISVSLKRMIHLSQ